MVEDDCIVFLRLGVKYCNIIYESIIQTSEVASWTSSPLPLLLTPTTERDTSLYLHNKSHIIY